MKMQPLRDFVGQHTENVYMTSYADIKDYYQDKYGQRGWIGALAKAVTGATSAKDKEYLAARRSFERVEKGQFKSSHRYGLELAKVGKQLPPIGKRLKGDSITVTITGKQHGGYYKNAKGNRVSKGERERTFTTTFTGADAISFADSPSYRDIFDNLGYPDNVIDLLVGDEDGDEDGDYALEVTSVA